MDIRTLRYFLAVAQAGSISKAACGLHVTQPTLSRQIADLERSLGCSLFERSSAGVSLTPEGAILRRRAEEMVSLEDAAKAEIGAEREAIVGDVRIGAGETHAMERVAQAMRTVQDNHPGVRFHVFSGNAVAVEEQLERGLVDFGLFVDAPPSSVPCEWVTLRAANRFGVLVRDDSPLADLKIATARDLADQRIIAPRQRRGLTTLDSLLGAGKEGLNVVATYNLGTNALYMVRAGMGVAVCLDVRAGLEASGLTFVPLEPPIVVDAHLAWKRGAVLSRACQAFRLGCAGLSTSTTG